MQYVILCLFVLFAFLAMLLPGVILEIFGLYWAALAYFIVGCLWLCLMPTTCRSGGFIASVLALPILLAGVCMPFIALVVFLYRLVMG